MNVVSCPPDRVDEDIVLVHSDVDLHLIGEAFREAEIPLVALLGVMHLRIQFSLLVLGGGGHSNQGGIQDRALLHGRALLPETSFHRRLKDLIAQAPYTPK